MLTVKGASTVNEQIIQENSGESKADEGAAVS